MRFLKLAVLVFIVVPIIVAAILFGPAYVYGVLLTLLNIFVLLSFSTASPLITNALNDQLAVNVVDGRLKNLLPTVVVNLNHPDVEVQSENSDLSMQYATSMELPPEYREWFRNPDGSCVQCSIGMVGMHMALPEWTYVLWDTEYGRAQRGGSYPSRVERYARERNMNIFNVVGNSYEDTRKWMLWAAKTNRFCAIGAGARHFQTLYGYDPSSTHPWKVCNNNSTWKVDSYTESEFRRLHMASGPWVVVPNEPSSPKPPVLVSWWEDQK